MFMNICLQIANRFGKCEDLPEQAQKLPNSEKVSIFTVGQTRLDAVKIQAQ